MPRFFFDVFDRGDVYHGARGAVLQSFEVSQTWASSLAFRKG